MMTGAIITAYSSPPVADAAASGIVPSPKLVKAAHEFEAAMMKELLAPMVPGHSAFSDEDQAGSASALGDYAGEALGQALSEQGGFGIAKSIIRQLTAQSRLQSNHSGSPSVPPPVTQNDAVFSHK